MILKKFLKLGVLGLSILLLFLTFLQLYNFKYSGSDKFKIVNAIRNYNVNNNYSLARSYYNSEDYKSAELYYAKTLNSNPLFTKSLVDLSEINLESDKYENVEILLNRSYELTPYSFKLLWRMAIISFWINNNDLALNFLTKISKVDDGKVFDIAWRVFDDNELIMSNLVNNNNIVNYLEFLIRKRKVDESITVWNLIKEKGIYDDKLSDKYINFLIKNDKIAEAAKIWKDRYGDINLNSPVLNGGFEKKPINKGFGWNIDKTESVFIGYDWEEKKEGNYSLQLIFNGKENVEFNNVSKIVPVKPNSVYKFSSFMKTKDVTTSNGLFWHINCTPNWRLLRADTKTITGTNDWELIEYDLSIPENCHALKLTLRRQSSKKLNNLISGNVWVDDINIVRVNSNEKDRN